MAMTKIFEWTVFIGAVLAVLAGLIAGLAMALPWMMTAMGNFAGLLVTLLISWGTGALLVFVAVQVWFWLAEHGWFE